jgi:hypothetical protein
MILNDLLGPPALDSEGRRLGVVIDARFVLDGAPSQLLAGARLPALLVSPRTASSFLGYERSGVTAPRPIGAFLSWRHRGSFFVAWEDIALVAEDAVHLRPGFTRLPLSATDPSDTGFRH